MPIEVSLEFNGSAENSKFYLRAKQLCAFIGDTEVVIIKCKDDDDGAEIFAMSHDIFTSGNSQGLESTLTPDNLAVEIPKDGKDAYCLSSFNGVEAYAKVRHLSRLVFVPPQNTVYN